MIILPVLLMMTWWADGHREFMTQRFANEEICERMAKEIIEFGWEGYRPGHSNYPKYKCVREQREK